MSSVANRSGSFYQVPVTQGQLYEITLTNATGSVGLSTSDTSFTAPGAQTNTCQQGSVPSTATGASGRCLATAGGSVMYVVVPGWAAGPGSTTFSLAVASASAPVSEGTSGSPIPVTGSHAGSVAAGGKSYYSFAMNTAVPNAIVVTNADSDGLQFIVPQSAGLNGYSTLGWPVYVDAFDSNTGTASQATLTVDGTQAAFGANYTVELLQPGSIYDSGVYVSGAPTITTLTVGTPASVQVAPVGFTPYSAAVSSGSIYLVTLSQATGIAGFKVFSDSSYTTEICTTQSNFAFSLTQTCRVKAPGSTLYFGTFISWSVTGSTGTMTVSAATLPSSQGSVGAPVSLGTAPLYAFPGTVDTTTSYYTATVTPGLFYGVTLIADQAVTMNVYDNVAFTGTPACSVSVNATSTPSPNGQCGIVPSANTIYVSVNGSTTGGAGSAYTIDVVH